MGVELPRIEISARHKQELADKYEVTRNTIRNALNYFSSSEQAQEIRMDAIEILKQEAKKAQQLIN